MTPEDRAQLRVDWHLAGHPDHRAAQWQGMFTGDDSDEDAPFAPGSDVLLLSGCGLDEVPDFVFDVPDVVMLVLGNQPLAHLSPAIGRMVSLEILDLTGTKLETLPEAVFALPKLTELYLQGAPIVALPSMAGSKITHLTLDGSKMVVLPDFGKDMLYLKTLSLNNCGLHDVPASLASAKILAHLSLSKNPLKVVPKALADMSSLQRLDLETCGLTTLPAWFADLPFEAMFAELRERRRARALASGEADAVIARRVAAAFPGFMGVNLKGNPFKDKALRAATKIKDTEERWAAIKDWCRQKGA